MHRKLAAVSSEVQVTRPQVVASQRSKERSGSIHHESSHAKRLIKGEGTPPFRFQRANSHSEFLKQVAEKLADRWTTPTASGSESGSVSPAETPMLPTLSPTSSVATFVFASTSESSGLSSDEEDDRHWGRRSSTKGKSGGGTPRSRRDGRGGSISSGMYDRFQPQQ